jgi:hypothetical protein
MRVRSVRGTIALEDSQAMIAAVQSSKGPASHVMDTASGVPFRSADVGRLC